MGKRSALHAFRNQCELGNKYAIAIVTTAALPWKTGTAVNALLRAAYCADLGHHVTLCVPWIHPSDQAHVFPRIVETPAAQEALMREWLMTRDGEHRPFVIRFYPARYDVVRGSILPLGDTTRWMGDQRRELCVLEEPEHLNWYHGGRNWRRQFQMVVGVVHTNYLSYARIYQPENVPIVSSINRLVCRAYCDRVLKLSDSLQTLPRSGVCNVHGVRAEFIAIGRRAAEPSHRFTGGAYFIGKILWAKGHRLLIDYLSGGGEGGGALRTRVDVHGDGDDAEAVQAAARAANLNLRFCGARDHADKVMHGYKVFVNPSQTEVPPTVTPILHLRSPSSTALSVPHPSPSSTLVHGPIHASRLTCPYASPRCTSLRLATPHRTRNLASPRGLGRVAVLP